MCPSNVVVPDTHPAGSVHCTASRASLAQFFPLSQGWTAPSAPGAPGSSTVCLLLVGSPDLHTPCGSEAPSVPPRLASGTSWHHVLTHEDLDSMQGGLDFPEHTLLPLLLEFLVPMSVPYLHPCSLWVSVPLSLGLFSLCVSVSLCSSLSLWVFVSPFVPSCLFSGRPLLSPLILSPSVHHLCPLCPHHLPSSFPPSLPFFISTTSGVLWFSTCLPSLSPTSLPRLGAPFRPLWPIISLLHLLFPHHLHPPASLLQLGLLLCPAGTGPNILREAPTAVRLPTSAPETAGAHSAGVRTQGGRVRGGAVPGELGDLTLRSTFASVPGVRAPCVRRRCFRPHCGAGERLPEVTGSKAATLLAAQVLVCFQLREFGEEGRNPTRLVVVGLP